MTILAIDNWASNADLIADCAQLGYLRPEWRTLDPTYGKGTFWKKWRPERLVACDLDPFKSPHGSSVDFTNLPFHSESFDAVVFDPPYKLNGRPDPAIDGRYGVAEKTNWRDRMKLIRLGMDECCRVLNDVGYLLVKCQDQVCSGKIRWQSIDIINVASAWGLGLVDRFEFLSYRPQPEGRRQVHAHRASSQLLVFQRGWES